jgi:hypothetical protein
MTKEEYTVISASIDQMGKNILESIARLRDVVRLATDDDHDCHADTPEGHCNHPSHPEL